MTPTSGDPGLRVIYFQSAGTDPYRILATSIRVPVCQTRIMMIPRILPLALTLLAPMAALAQAPAYPRLCCMDPTMGVERLSASAVTPSGRTPGVRVRACGSGR
jgi:hypothetical protein